MDGPNKNDGDSPRLPNLNEQAVKKALSFVGGKIITAAEGEFTPLQAVQLGVEYLFYIHQGESLILRQLDSSETINRDSEGIGKGMYNAQAKAVVKTGQILDSMHATPDLLGLRDFIASRGRIMEIVNKIGVRSNPITKEEDGKKVQDAK